MDDGHEGVVVLLVPQALQGFAALFPVSGAGCFVNNEFLDRLGHRHRERTAQRIHLARVVLCHDVLSSREGTEPDCGRRAALPVERRRAETPQLRVDERSGVVEVRLVQSVSHDALNI